MAVDFLTNERLSEIASSFLREYHPDDTIPVPIEEIIELKLEMDIIPVPNLQRSFGVEGALAGDFTGIYVDDYVQSARTNRYRFTLAHEVGHFFMHREHLGGFGPFDSIGQWIACLNGMNGKERDCMEYHGYAFAGYVLVPTHHLKTAFSARMHEAERLIEQAKGLGCSRNMYLQYAVSCMANLLAGTFEVSPEVMDKRIRAEKLEELFT
jgi:hypothetical protein